MRAFAETALETLLKSGASKDGPPPSHRNLDEEIASTTASILTLLPSDLVITSAKQPNGPPSPRHPILGAATQFSASLVTDLVYARRFTDIKQWERCVGPYFVSWLHDDAPAFSEQVRSHFFAIDQVSCLPDT